MGNIKILDAGPLTTVQDKGRYGFQRYGVSVSGVMDEYSASIANYLVGNSSEEAVLECTMKGPSIEFLADTVFAVTGGETKITLNGVQVTTWQSHTAKAGDKLAFDFCKNSIRNYIAFNGGIDVPLVMKSRSTNLKAGLGGFDGRKLQNGDILKTAGTCFAASGRRISNDLIPVFSKEITVSVVLGQQMNAFTEKGIETFFSSVYEVSQENDRMGIRLTGAEIEHVSGADIISDGITFGAIQIPGNGNPIIMMADRQTTGGYTKIGNIITADLPKLAQATTGTKVKFKKVELEYAVTQAVKMYDVLNNLDKYPHFEKGAMVLEVNVNGNTYSVGVEIVE